MNEMFTETKSAHLQLLKVGGVEFRSICWFGLAFSTKTDVKSQTNECIRIGTAVRRFIDGFNQQMACYTSQTYNIASRFECEYQ